MKITYIGHATTLIEMGEERFLTDPNFSNQVLWFQKRLAPPGIAPDALPDLNGVLISRPDYDHLDLFSYKYFKLDLPIITPKGVGKRVQKFLPNPVVEIPAGGFHQTKGIKILAFKEVSWAWRLVPLPLYSAVSYILESSEESVFFAGKTSYGDHFAKIGTQFKIDVAILPIGQAVSPKSKRKHGLSPHEALVALKDLGAKHLIPIRWGSFSKNPNKVEGILEQLENEVKNRNLEDWVHVLKPGDSWEGPNEKVLKFGGLQIP